MPYLSIQTNCLLGELQQASLLDAASKVIATNLNKPEEYVMASFIHAKRMKFAGSDSPTAFLEVSSIGVPDSQRNPLVADLTRLVAADCKIKPERVFIVLADVQARFWAANGATVG